MRPFLLCVGFLAAVSLAAPDDRLRADTILAPGTYRSFIGIGPVAELSPCTDGIVGYPAMAVDFTLSRLGGGGWLLRFEGQSVEYGAWLRGVARFTPEWTGVEIGDEHAPAVVGLDLDHLEQLNVTGALLVSDPKTSDWALATVHLGLGPGGSLRDCRLVARPSSDR